MQKVSYAMNNMDYNTAISTSALFHYTNRECLEKIIYEGFKPRVSWENFDVEKNVKIEDIKRTLGCLPSSNTSFKLGIPMICFCDIPINLVKTHIKVYGEYAIGLTKKWAVNQQGICPVIYVSHGSEFMGSFRALFQTMQKDSLKQIEISVYSILRLIKPYIGFFEKGKYKNENHKFYDEREWRYVPPFFLCKPYFIENEYTESLLFNERTGIIGFNLEDIEHILVKDKSEIDFFYTQLKEKFGEFDKKKFIIP